MKDFVLSDEALKAEVRIDGKCSHDKKKKQSLLRPWGSYIVRLCGNSPTNGVVTKSEKFSNLT